jgi:hypothetical protein
MIVGSGILLVATCLAFPSASAAEPGRTDAPGEAQSDAAVRWGLDFLTTTACHDAKAGSGLEGFGSSFEYTDPRQGTLMSALAIAAQIVRVACLDPVTRDRDFSFYCGTLTGLFGSAAGAIGAERLKLRDFIRDFGAASRDERRAVVKSVVAQFEQCGRQDELRSLAAVLHQGLSEYQRLEGKLGLARCRTKCDPRSKKDWGVGRQYVRSKNREIIPTTEACFVNCSADFYGASALVKFIHRRVLQGISVEELRELTGLLTPVKPRGRAEVNQPGTDLNWLRCAVGQTWDGKACTGAAPAKDWSAAMTACPAGYRLPTAAEFGTLLGCPDEKGTPAGEAATCRACQREPACLGLFGQDAGKYWSRSPGGMFHQAADVSFATGQFSRPMSGAGYGSAAVRCVRWVPAELRVDPQAPGEPSEPPTRKVPVRKTPGG